MGRMKTFFIYFLLVVLFFIFSQIVIALSLHTSYSYKSVEIKTTIPITAEAQATSVNGYVKGKILNNTGESIQNKFIKVECYTKNNVLQGTKYIEIENINTKETLEYEIKFNYSKVEKVVIDIVDEISDDVPEEDKISDPEMNFAMLVTALILLYVI